MTAHAPPDTGKAPALSRRRLFAFAALWLAVSGTAVVGSACYGRTCDGGLEIYGKEPGEGRMVTPDVWESTGQMDKWLWFPGQRTWAFDIPALGNRIPYDTTVYLSAQEDPNRTGNHTQGGGNLALLSFVGPNRVNVTNDSCSDFYLRLVVRVPPLPPEAGDGGGASPATPEVDAGTEDAGEDAGPDDDADP